MGARHALTEELCSPQETWAKQTPPKSPKAASPCCSTGDGKSTSGTMRC